MDFVTKKISGRKFLKFETKIFDIVCAQKLITHHGEYNFIDCYHFSAPNKKWNEDYYSPIVTASKAIFHM